MSYAGTFTAAAYGGGGAGGTGVGYGYGGDYGAGGGGGRSAIQIKGSEIDLVSSGGGGGQTAFTFDLANMSNRDVSGGDAGYPNGLPGILGYCNTEAQPGTQTGGGTHSVGSTCYGGDGSQYQGGYGGEGHYGGGNSHNVISLIAKYHCLLFYDRRRWWWLFWRRRRWSRRIRYLNRPGYYWLPYKKSHNLLSPI